MSWCTGQGRRGRWAIATVDFWGVRRQVRLDVVDEPVQPGDYILNHVGFAIRRIPAEDIAATLALYEELLAARRRRGRPDGRRRARRRSAEPAMT